MTQLVTRLERDGYVERGGSRHDARVVLVSLTDSGREFLRHRRELRAAHLGDLLDRLTAEDKAQILAAIPALNLLAALGQESV
jgi:DNA-binding MarR family transcriptional regulator